ncbi:MAG: tRNA-dihydrouridine synthase family protein [Lachnospiraceae bacterium]|nr:tRNA-dihydrouridine synthase family protein [Lachnospiraceae bacterium]
MTDTFYFAPMEGITLYPLREAHHQFFPGVDAYYLPFIDTHETKTLKTKEKKDIDPANNKGMTAVPQLLSKRSDLFVWYAKTLREKGYREINLNLGCPSKTVVPKGKGAGFLRDLDAVDEFLDGVFTGLADEDIAVSVKTRTGMDVPEPEKIAAVLNRYPFSRVIVHPRLGKMFYEGTPDLDAFQAFCEASAHPVTYNGDLCTREDLRMLKMRFPDLQSFMIGRGLLKNPALVREFHGDSAATPEELIRYSDAVMRNWLDDLGDEKQTLGRMKELWLYMIHSFPGRENLLKQLRKAKTLHEFSAIIYFGM